MSAVLYPVAPNAERALNAPVARAAREREAARAVGGPVRFVSEETGPAFATREAALDAFRGRLDDERPGARCSVAAEDAYLGLREVAAETARGRLPAPVRPAMKNGRRWPAPPPKPATVWRLTVSYWKVVGVEEARALEQARRLRRARETEPLDAAALRDLARQPLRPIEPQRPLDIGLFECRPPEAPDRVIPDE